MALKKSDLYASLWAGADELRGGMDASQYKDYVLTLLFVKYVSDKAKADPYADIEVPEGGSFDDLVAVKGKPDIGEQVNVAISALAQANDLQGIINIADFDDPDKLGKGKELVDRVTKLIGIFQDLDFTGSRAEGDDLLGDAYEYLMRHFATEAGKSKGQFYTPAEVSRVMAALIGIQPGTPKSATVYDPTCGSGSLLLKVADAAPNGLTIYGQEKDNATRALAVMNMVLHGNATAVIKQGDTITSPQFLRGTELQTFDYLVANPPFSVKSWTNGLEHDYGRFDGYARPPAKNGDYAFLLHMIKSLKSSGKGAVILPHGVLFRGNAEATIRKELIKRGYIKGIIGLPANLFYGTGIPACIIVLDKEDTQARSGIFMVDASKGFAKDGNKNRLRPRDMHQIIDAFVNLKEIDRYSRMVPVSEIASAKNEYSLNIPRYIDGSESEDIHDLHAHLKGGIPNRDLDALQPYWEAVPSLRSTLFKPLRDSYSELAVDKSEIQGAITGSAEFQTLVTSSNGAVNHWWNTHAALLRGISHTTRPNELISELGETLLGTFRPRPLVDEYGVYEQLMSYWNDVMHDDVALVMGAGWNDAVRPRPARILGYDGNKRPKHEPAHITFGTGVKAERWVMDLVPPEIIVARYFSKERAALEALGAAVEAAGQEIEEYVEERAGEEGVLFDATGDDGKVTSKTANDRLKAARGERADREELDALVHVISLFKAEAAAKKAAKDAKVKLDRLTLEQYSKLSIADIQNLVIDDKWATTVLARVASELHAVVSTFVSRIRALVERYRVTLGELDTELADARDQVARLLGSMGASGLLDGSRRLPGFADTWRTVNLGEHVSYVRTVALSRAQLDAESPTRYLHYGDIHTSEAIYLDAEAAPMPRARADRLKTAGFLERGDLIFADASEDPAGVGKSVEITSTPPEGVVPGLHTIAARFDKDVLADGFKAYLQFIPEFRGALLRLAAGTKVLATTRNYISSISMSLPSVDEQKAIVEALQCVNREIDLSRCRVAKGVDVRTAMRQELLNGRTRLVPTESAA